MATTITVSTAADLRTALANAKGGETINLAPGDYGYLGLGNNSGFNVDFPSNVTITSANPLKPASFSGLDLDSVSNLTIDSVVMDYTFKPGDPLYTTPFSINASQNVTIQNSTFSGDLAKGMSAIDDGYGVGTGLTISGSAGITIAGNDISSFFRGMTVSNSTGTTISGNDLSGIRSDGMDFIQVQGVVIEGNRIHDFQTAPNSEDHPDMIQFWTAGTTAPSTDITIRNNVLDIGKGIWTQSIFMGNEVVGQGLAGSAMYYRNVTIEGNVITNGQLHGITVAETNGLVIRQNTVLHSDGAEPDGADSAVEIPSINLASNSTNVTVTGNVTSAVNGWTGQSGWAVSQNAFVQDQNPDAPGYYGNVFISSSLTAQNGVNDFLALPGGMVDLLGAGAPLTRNYLPAAGGVAALFQESVDPNGSGQTRVFDASLSLSDKGTLPVGAVYEWSFGDGTTATGMKVSHTFGASGGRYDVVLTVRLPSGVSDSVDGLIGIQSNEVVTLGADGVFRAMEYGSTILLDKSPFASSAGIDLGATGVAASIGSGNVSDILRTNNFDIAMRLDASTKTSAGEVFRLHGSIIASVTQEGGVQIQAYGQGGTLVSLYSSGVTVNDMNPHDIAVSLRDGVLQLLVDGKVSAQTDFAGTLSSFGSQDMTFGNPWGAKNFDGYLTGFDIKVGASGTGAPGTGTSPVTDGSSPTQTPTPPVEVPTPPVQVPTPPVTPTVPHQVQTGGHTVPVETAPPISVHLGDVGVATHVAAKQLTGLMSTQSFHVSMTLDADNANSSGQIFSLRDSLVTSVNSTGDLVVSAHAKNGSRVSLVSSGTSFTDLKSHDVDIQLQDGKLQLWVDNTLSTQADFAGTLHKHGQSALNFGDRHASLNFDGDLTAFDISLGNGSTWTSPSIVLL